MPEQPKPKPKIVRRRRKRVAGGREQTKRSSRVLMSPEEAEVLAARSAEEGVSVPRLLLECALAERGETSTMRRDAMVNLFAMRRSLAGIANNVNQLARVANTEGHTPVGTAAALQSVRDAALNIDAAIDELRR